MTSVTVPNDRCSQFLLSICITFFTTGAAVAKEGDTSPQRRFPKLEFRKWSGDINVPDPVSVSVDDRGRVFATQTRRRKIQDLDIREHTEWIAEDVALSSVEEKRAFLKRKLAVGGDQSVQRKHVLDLNEDGQHDWRDLKSVSEAIYRLRDSDEDGTADEISIFAEDFQTEVTGIAAGVLAYNGDVWATVAPDLWKLRDTDDDGQADERSVIAHGFGLHIAYAGHDMHGLTVGPDGKIYWSIGDKGISVTRADGRRLFYPNQGGVLRCNPDGSDFEVFAHGLRNVQELAFDKYGNLFGVDNDADQPGEKERFVYIANGMDAGWRCNYQYRGASYNPWVDEKLWDLPGDDHPAYIVPPLSHYVDGPAGLVYNPGTALAPEYYDFFFLTSAPNGQQYAFRAEPEGDAFRMVDDHQIGSGIAIVGWNWGPDGGLYGADWDGGYPLDQKGAVVRVDAPGADLDLREEVRLLLRDGLRERANEDLAALLGHQDQRVRLRAQFELAARGQFELLRRVTLLPSADPVQRIHAIWGLGQLARAGNRLAAPAIADLFSDDDYHVRGQAVKTFGELPSVDSHQILPLLNDESEYVRVLAAIALARHPHADAVQELLKCASSIEADQHYLRHAHAWALSQCAVDIQLSEPKNRAANVMQRMCCVVALRHRRSPVIASYLNDPSDWVATEAARAIHDDFSIVKGLAALATSLNARQDQSEAFSRRAINANFRDGSSQAAQRVATFAADETRGRSMRVEAVDALQAWHDHKALDRVDGRNRHLEPRELDPSVVAQQLTSVINSDDPVLRTKALLAAQQIGVPLSDSMLAGLVRDSGLEAGLRAAALMTLTERETKLDLAGLALQVLESRSVRLRQQAIATLCSVAPEAGIAAAKRLIGSASNPLPLRQTAIRVLVDVPGSDRLLNELLNEYRESQLDRRLALDLFESLESDGRLQAPEGVDMRSFARDGGDRRRGELLFRTHQQAQCSRCHRVGRFGSDVGPELSQIGAKRDADYLLRAIVEPSADIDEKYRAQLYLLESGEVVKGVPLKEGESETTIADSEGNQITIANEDILQTKVQTVSLMPDMRDALTPSELRDLVAYLRSLKGR